MRPKTVILLLLSAFCLTATRGQDSYVSHWGSHTPPFDTWEKAATNLMDAVNAAPDGSVVWVTNGVYRTGAAPGGGMQNRLSLTRPLTVRSVNGYSNTVIEGAFHSPEVQVGPNAVRGVYMTNGTLDGFTIRRGSTYSTGAETVISGGGLYADGGTQSNIRVTGNHGQTAAGAWLQSCSVTDSLFEMNFSETGPRVKINRLVSLENCRINHKGVMFPDAKILGTNGSVIINADRELNLENGSYFGEVVVVNEELIHEFTITNAGVRTLSLTGWSVIGGNSEDFTVTPPAGNTVAPGNITTFTVKFAPSKAGLRQTALWMTCNDPDDDPYVVWISGEGIQAEMIVLATNYSVITNGSLTPLPELGTDFGEARTIRDVITNTYIITNAGPASMTVFDASLSGGAASEFAVVTIPAGIVPAGGTTNFSVSFDPGAPGSYTTTVVIAHDAPDSPYEFTIQGLGVEPEMRVLGVNKDWIQNGDTTPNETDGTDFGVCLADPIRRVFAITNSGTSLLTLTNMPHVAVTGEHPFDFTVIAQPSTTLLEPGAVTTFEIEFIPLVADVRIADVVVYSDDIYHTNETYTFRVTGTGSTNNQFVAISANIQNVGASSMAWGDYNNNGLLDLAVLGYDGTNRFTDIYQNLGNSTFTNINAGIVQLESGSLEWGDFDNDGWLDLVVMGFDGAGAVTAIYRNQGDGTFSNINAGLVGAYSGGLAVGDYDNDGDLDLIITGYTRSNSVAIVYRNDGNGVFTPMDFGLRPVRSGRAAWVDYNNSGRLDLLITGDDGAGKTTRLYRNYGGSFTNIPLSGIPGVSYSGLSFGDFNSDGKLDMALTGYSPTDIISHVYRYNSESTPYTLASGNLEPVWLGDCKWGDFNNNGHLDLVLSGAGTNNTRHVALYENTGGSLSRFSALIPGLRVSSMAWGDFDSDGDLDLAISGQATNGYRSFIYRNLASISNTPPTAPAGLNATLENGNEIVFRWDHAFDEQTPSNSLTYNLFVGTATNIADIMHPHADMATGLRRIAAMGNVQMNREWRLKNLPSGDIYWGVQAVDSGYMGGPFAHGSSVTVPELPDLVISDIQIMNVPFQASVTVSNKGTVSSTDAVKLSAWLNRPDEAGAGASSDLTNTVGILAAGATETVVFSGLAQITNTVTNTFRAYVNSVAVPDVYEVRYDNNQLARVYTNMVYEPFWFNAVALTNDIILRWIDPASIGMQSSEVLIHWSNSSYPATTSDGSFLYKGTGQTYQHTGRTSGQPCYYTIWVTHDGVNWLAPPE